MIEPTTAVAAQTAAPAETTTTAIGQLGSDAFLKLLITQLRYQNPMNPMDGAAMMQQTAQLTTVETLKAISETNQRLMGFQQITMALAVVGMPVSALSPEGSAVEGVVESLRFTVDGPLLRLDNGIEISMDNVFTVGGADMGVFELLPPVEAQQGVTDPVAPPESAIPEVEVSEAPSLDEADSSSETSGPAIPEAAAPEVATTPGAVIRELVIPEVVTTEPVDTEPAAPEVGVPGVAAP